MATFNFSSLQQKADQVIHNADEAVRKWVDLTLAPAKDVPVEYYDPNGNLIQTTVPNRAKLFNNLLVNVNSAMKKVIYVDAVNGLDTGDGSQRTPFKTLQKAIDSVPPGGVGFINLISDYTLERITYVSQGRIITIKGTTLNSDGSPVITLRNDPNNTNSMLLIENSFLTLTDIKLECNNNGGISHWSTLLKVGINRRSTVTIGRWVDLTKYARPVEIVLNHPMINIENSIADLIMMHTKIIASSALDLVTYHSNGKCLYTATGIVDTNSNVTFPAIGIN